KTQTKYHLTPAIMALIAIFIVSARAGETAIGFDTTQYWSLSGGTGVLRWQFTTRSDIQVSALGLYDNFSIYSGGFPGDGLVEQHPIGIWDISSPSDPLVSALIPAGTAAQLMNGFRYVSVGPVVLPAGHDYVIGALYLSQDLKPMDFTTQAINNPTFVLTVSPEIEFEGYRWDNLTVLAFPQSYHAGEVGAFGPNFVYADVPEPSTLALDFLTAAVLLG